MDQQNQAHFHILLDYCTALLWEFATTLAVCLAGLFRALCASTSVLKHS
eukprot:COSAG02_NODE_3313_length_6953_cov_95.249635_2_plen_49_part_00